MGHHHGQLNQFAVVAESYTPDAQSESLGHKERDLMTEPSHNDVRRTPTAVERVVFCIPLSFALHSCSGAHSGHLSASNSILCANTTIDKSHKSHAQAHKPVPQNVIGDDTCSKLYLWCPLLCNAATSHPSSSAKLDFTPHLSKKKRSS